MKFFYSRKVDPTWKPYTRKTFGRPPKAGDPWWWCVTPVWLDRLLGLTWRWG